MKARILAIDDSLTIRRVLETGLGRVGYSLDTAARGADGIALAQRVRPDLILLDYVLPDMKGLDVCSALAEHAATRTTPVVVMSAKGEALRPVFQGMPTVVGYLPKPFTASEAAYLISDTLRQHSGAPPAPAPSPNPDREVLARAIYAALRERLGLIPEWSAQRGTEAPAPFFGRKILTSAVVESVVATVSGLASGPQGPASSDPRVLLGHTSVLPLIELLQRLIVLGRTGVLQVTQQGRVTRMFLRKGELIAATDDQPEEAWRRAVLRGTVSSLDPARAAAEQRLSGMPVLLTFAADRGGKTPEIEAALQEESAYAVVATLQGEPAPFVWTDGELPVWCAEISRGLSLEQVQLTRLRDLEDWTQVETQVPSLDLRFARCSNFSQRLSRFTLTENERRILTVVNDRHTVRDVIDRTGLPTFEVFHTLFRLLQVQLIQRATPDTRTSEISAPDMPAVLICGANEAEITEPLARALGKRRMAAAVLRIEPSEDPLTVLRRRRPRVAIFDASLGIGELASRAEGIRSTLEVSDIPLLASISLEQSEEGMGDDLRKAGFDGVLVRPFLIADVERFLPA